MFLLITLAVQVHMMWVTGFHLEPSLAVFTPLLACFLVHIGFYAAQYHFRTATEFCFVLFWEVFFAFF